MLDSATFWQLLQIYIRLHELRTTEHCVVIVQPRFNRSVRYVWFFRIQPIVTQHLWPYHLGSGRTPDKALAPIIPPVHSSVLDNLDSEPPPPPLSCCLCQDCHGNWAHLWTAPFTVLMANSWAEIYAHLRERAVNLRSFGIHDLHIFATRVSQTQFHLFLNPE